jgi:hypothetical protein
MKNECLMLDAGCVGVGNGARLPNADKSVTRVES